MNIKKISNKLDIQLSLSLSHVDRLIIAYSLKAEKFSGCLLVLIHCLMSMFREHCSSLHQSEKQPNKANCNIHETLAFNDLSRHGEPANLLISLNDIIIKS